MIAEEKLKSIQREQEAIPADTQPMEDTFSNQKTEGGVNLFAVQVILCILLSVVLIGMYLFVPEKFEQIKEYYISQESVLPSTGQGVIILEE